MKVTARELEAWDGGIFKVRIRVHGNIRIIELFGLEKTLRIFSPAVRMTLFQYAAL